MEWSLSVPSPLGWAIESRPFRASQTCSIDGAVALVHLQLQETQRIIEAISNFRLDFDDAYQYVAAERENLIIVSFDRDFDRTERGRRTPLEALSRN
ncbi:MAG: PIN domain-containing protein [Blastocatellia bacterium]